MWLVTVAVRDRLMRERRKDGLLARTTRALSARGRCVRRGPHGDRGAPHGAPPCALGARLDALCALLAHAEEVRHTRGERSSWQTMRGWPIPAPLRFWFASWGKPTRSGGTAGPLRDDLPSRAVGLARQKGLR